MLIHYEKPAVWRVSLFEDRKKPRCRFLSAAVAGDSAFGGSFQLHSACFAITPAADYGFGANFRFQSGPAFPGCRALLFLFSDGTCMTATNNHSSPFISPDASTWVRIGQTVSTVGTHAQLHVACQMSSDFSVPFEDVYAGPGLTMPVELERFSVD